MWFSVVTLFWHTTDTFVSLFALFYEQQKIGIKASGVKVRSKTQFDRFISFFPEQGHNACSPPRSISHSNNKFCHFFPVVLLYAEIPGTSNTHSTARLIKFALLHTNRSEISLDLADEKKETPAWRSQEGEANSAQNKKQHKVSLQCSHVHTYIAVEIRASTLTKKVSTL